MNQFENVSNRDLLLQAKADFTAYRERGFKRTPLSVITVRRRINSLLKANPDRLAVARSFGYTTEPGLRAALSLIDLDLSSQPVCVTSGRAGEQVAA